MKRIIFILFLFMTVGCQDEEPAESLLLDVSIPGTWLYTEYGYSPGYGYFTKPVPPVPAQTITFGSDFKLSTNIDGIEQYKFYRMLEDPNTDGTVMAFFVDDPENENLEISELDHSYSMVKEGSLLKLYYRWCIEGCHIGFEKVSGSEME